MRERARAEGRSVRYDGRWRDRDPSEAPPGARPVIRFRAPREGETVIDDLVQGEVHFANSQLDDMVLLRSDGTPTYMLSVVVDDHDMEITHVVRGDDHLNNAARQTQLYRALGWEPPRFAHIPLIHGPDGAKLSKRHGALSVSAYRDMGFLPEAMRNYLLRLGWSHGDDEIISTEQAIAWFGLEAVGGGPPPRGRGGPPRGGPPRRRPGPLRVHRRLRHPAHVLGAALDVAEGQDLVVHVDLACGGEGLADGVGLHHRHPEEVQNVVVVGILGARMAGVVIAHHIGTQKQGPPRFGLAPGGQSGPGRQGADHPGSGTAHAICARAVRRGDHPPPRLADHPPTGLPVRPGPGPAQRR
jgi:hypothetical protein